MSAWPFAFEDDACAFCGETPTAFCSFRLGERTGRCCGRFVCYRHAHEPDDGVAYCLGMHLIERASLLKPADDVLAYWADRDPEFFNPTRARYKPLRAPGERRSHSK